MIFVKGLCFDVMLISDWDIYCMRKKKRLPFERDYFSLYLFIHDISVQVNGCVRNGQERERAGNDFG